MLQAEQGLEYVDRRDPTADHGHLALFDDIGEVIGVECWLLAC